MHPNLLLMKRLMPLLLLLSAVLALPACKGKNRDGEIQTAINNKSANDPNLTGVSATVVNGEVTLTGTCADEPCRTNAEKAVKGIEGVKKVTNNIAVARVEVTPDNQLQASVQEAVEKYEGVQASVSGGVITLRGQVERDELQQLMMDMNALRPSRIDNQLVIK